MTRDLGDLMWAAAGERAGALDGLVPEADDLARVRARVRRGRAVRHVREAAVALPVVAAVVAAGWFGLDRLAAPEPPVTTPEPVQPTPDRTPSPTPTDDAEDPVLGDPVDEPGFPTYYAMPDGLLDAVGPGWVLASYSPRPVLGLVPATEILFLVSPEGTRFAAARFDVEMGETANRENTWVEHVPVHWDGGATAVVREDAHLLGYFSETVTEGPLLTLDLVTGELTGPATAILPPDDGWLDAYGPDGRAVTGVTFSDRFTLEPDGPAPREVPYGVDGRLCYAVGWLDSANLLAGCVDEAAADEFGDVWEPYRHDPALYRVPVEGGAPERLASIGPDDSLPGDFRGVWVRDGVVAFPSADFTLYECMSGVDVWADGAIRPLQRPVGAENIYTLRAQGSRVYVNAEPGCSGDPAPSSLTVHDLDAGTSVELLPASVTPPEGGWSRTLTGWVVVE